MKLFMAIKSKLRGFLTNLDSLLNNNYDVENIKYLVRPVIDEELIDKILISIT